MLQPRTFVAASTDKGSESALRRVDAASVLERVPRSREVLQSYVTSVISTLWALVACVPLVYRAKPRLLLVNGPGTSLPVCLVAYILALIGLCPPVAIVFIESACRVHSLSLTGKILLRLGLCTLFIVQWKELATKHPNAVFLPLIFDDDEYESAQSDEE